jgi:FkbM family methyltransferase
MLSQSNKWRMSYRCWRYRFKSEVPSISFVRNSRLAGKTLLDVGANRGIYSIYLSRAAGPGGHVFAFEPQPELKAHLETVKKRFRLENLTIHNFGLSSSSGTLLMRRPKPGSGAAGFHIDAAAEWEELDVPVVRLDDFIEQASVGPVHLIKCDVESHELEVFRGGEATLKRDLPALIFECNHEIASRGELFGFLFGLGYDGYFYHVARKDQQTWIHRNRGFYVNATKFAEYEYVRPSVDARIYLFLKRGLDPTEVHAGSLAA